MRYRAVGGVGGDGGHGDTVQGDRLQRGRVPGGPAQPRPGEVQPRMRTLRQHRQQCGGCLACIIWSKVELNLNTY